MDEHALKHIDYAQILKLKFNILKEGLSALQKFQPANKLDFKPKKKQVKTVAEELEEDFNIPKYMTLSKLDWDNNEIHAGIIKDPTAKGGLRYQVIEPVLSERDQKGL